jgi:hypothetical protein
MTPLELASASHRGGGGVIFVIGAIIVGAVSLLHAVKPETAWKMRRWQFRNQAANEPSPAGYAAIRFGGIGGFAVAVVFVLLGTHVL